MPYTFRFLTEQQRQDIASRATLPPQAAVPDEAMQRAWEADLAAHQALLAAAKDNDSKARHGEAVKQLEQALTKAAART